MFQGKVQDLTTYIHALWGMSKISVLYTFGFRIVAFVLNKELKKLFGVLWNQSPGQGEGSGELLEERE